MDGGLCDELHKHHYVSENYKESVFRREKIMATDLGNNIAIPHGSEKEISLQGRLRPLQRRLPRKKKPGGL